MASNVTFSPIKDSVVSTSKLASKTEFTSQTAR